MTKKPTKKEIQSKINEAIKVFEQMSDATDTKYMILTSNDSTDKIQLHLNGKGYEIAEMLRCTMNDSDELRAIFALATQALLAHKDAKTLLDEQCNKSDEEETEEEDSEDTNITKESLLKEIEEIGVMAKDAMESIKELRDYIKSH